jgi:hypothetical protein
LDKVDDAAVADGLSRHAVVNPDGTLARGRGTTSSTKSAVGQYQVVFDGAVTNCALSATLADPATGAPPSGEIAAGLVSSNANAVQVETRDSTGATADRPFHLIVSC